jgi:hypothetical protein
MVQAIDLFSNVTKCTIAWPHGRYGIQSFYRAAWKKFGPNLRSLNLTLPLRSFEVLALSSAEFEVIDELSIVIPSTMDAVLDYSRILSGPVASFINRLAPRLRSFSLASSKQNLDLSPLFTHMHSFPKLHRFSFVLRSVLPDTVSATIRRILCDHADTIEHLEVVAYGFLETWLTPSIQSNASDSPLPTRLSSLELLVETDIKSVIEYARRSADTLTSLNLTGPYSMTYDEVYTLVNMFSHRPESQRLDTIGIRINVLSPQIIDVLASALPDLRELRLTVCNVASRDTVDPEPFTDLVTNLSFF